LDLKDTRIEQFFRGMAGKRVAILGIGITNIGLARLFAEHGAIVTACDRRSREQLGDNAGILEDAGASLKLGGDYLADLDVDVVFRTPGMYYFLPELVALRERGVVVTSEMEVFFDLCPCKTIAVTGSEGKTTTTTIITEMLKAQGKTVHLGGNIGKALLPLIHEIREEDVAVVELSSFQLISMRCAPAISIVTNVTPDHLDVHSGMEEYINAKRNIYLHQNAFSRTVLNADNEITLSFSDGVRGERMLFSLSHPVEHGAYLQDGILYAARYGDVKAVLSASDIKIPGLHNVANYLAAICAVTGLADRENVRGVAGTFGGVEHRLEFVRELGGVRWYNDSIATAPPAVTAALRSFDQKLIIIGGGYDKQISFEPLAGDLVSRVKLLILTGPTAPKIEAVVKAHPDYRDGTPEIIMAEDIPHAVQIARQKAIPGDVVSLSPASASFDCYPNFEARGRHFKELVHGL
jgi:UDP-N-acetylmuramoylalanine--D-glutamate ligase